jgi:flagellar biosynthesis protein FlhB
MLGLFVSMVLLLRLAAPKMLAFAGQAFLKAGAFSAAHRLPRQGASKLAVTYPEVIAEGVGMLGFGLLCVVVPIVIVVLIGGLVQTRCFFRLSLLSINLGRLLSGFSRFGIGGVVARFLGAWGGVLRLGLAVAAWFLALRFLLAERQVFEAAVLKTKSGWFKLEISAVSELALAGVKLASGVFSSLLFLCLLLAVLGWFINLFAFRRRHMMTRGEVEEEMRELEQGQEMRRARELAREE